jgi:plasmid stability protein
MKMTLDLPPDLIRAMKLRALNEHRKLKEVAAELLARGLDTEATQTGPAKGSIALPLFPTSSDAPAARMTTEQLLALEQATLHQEDLQRLGHAL